MPTEMEMQQALEERMKTLLEYASQAKVAAALGVTRTTVYRWAHGAAVTPGAVTRVQALLRPELAGSPLTQEEAPPPWAEGLATAVADSVVERITSRLELPFEQLAQEADRRIARRIETPRRTSAEQGAGQGGGQSAALPGSKQRKPKASSR